MLTVLISVSYRAISSAELLLTVRWIAIRCADKGQVGLPAARSALTRARTPVEECYQSHRNCCAESGGRRTGPGSPALCPTRIAVMRAPSPPREAQALLSSGWRVSDGFWVVSLAPCAYSGSQILQPTPDCVAQWSELKPRPSVDAWLNWSYVRVESAPWPFTLFSRSPFVRGGHNLILRAPFLLLAPPHRPALLQLRNYQHPG
ncbi:hypothetical protein FB451DRAFT_1481557 [Mycena latifolia]|nr:hypothetical protein FB451DRAFT_1481557 [Mycena latifolia]